MHEGKFFNGDYHLDLIYFTYIAKYNTSSGAKYTILSTLSVFYITYIFFKNIEEYDIHKMK